jgi:hypothetical protein
MKSARRDVMTAIPATRVISFALLAACTAFCQRNSKPARVNSLPDAPSVQSSTIQNPIDNPALRTFSDTARPYLNTAATGTHFDPGHFDLDDKADRKPSNAEDMTALLFRPSPRYRASNSDSLIGRATDAAMSIVFPRDEEGNRRLNTSYLVRVMTAAAAHSAYRPYWRRSISQPFNDFGSTVGNDAGMNVFHEFEPGILQLVKTHQPRFVTKIGEHFNHK